VLPVRGAGVREVYGYRRNGRGLFLSGGPKPMRENGAIAAVPITEYYLEIGRWMGLKVGEGVRPRLYISEETQRRGEELLRRYGIKEGELVIGLNPGASFGSSKCWPAENFARVAEMVEERFGAKVMLLTAPGEEEIRAAIMGGTKARVIDTGRDEVDLDLLKPLVRRCGVLITNDTGPRHYAVAFDVPVVVLMGPTNPGYTASNLERTEVIRVELGCSPCHKKVCPRGHECMRGITPAMVVEATERLLEKWN
jgi:heptosyltransferase-2